MEDFNAEDKLGFIMFECGLEGVLLKVINLVLSFFWK